MPINDLLTKVRNSQVCAPGTLSKLKQQEKGSPNRYIQKYIMYSLNWVKPSLQNRFTTTWNGTQSKRASVWAGSCFDT